MPKKPSEAKKNESQSEAPELDQSGDVVDQDIEQTDPESLQADQQASEGDSKAPASESQPSEAEAVVGIVALEILRPVAFGNGTRQRGFHMGTCPSVNGSPQLDAFEPAEGVNDDEVKTLKRNMQHVLIVPVS